MDGTYNLNGATKPPTRRFADLGGPDFYPTPNWATEALLSVETFSGTVWECACGDGAMSRVLEKSGLRVVSTDLYDRGFGTSGVDFLQSSKTVENIVTNPPFHSAESFVQKGLQHTTQKLALLLRIAFLEGVTRHRTIFTTSPPTRVYVFSERVTFYPAGKQRAGSGTTAYGWFVWDKNSTADTSLRWIAPGMKKRTALDPLMSDSTDRPS